MSDTQDGNHLDPSVPDRGVCEDDAATSRWVDGHGRTWHVELRPHRIVLKSKDDLVELPADSWARDIYLAPHGDGFIIRFSTFELELGFVVSGEQAQPLLEYLGRRAETRSEPPAADEETADRTPLLWPKVSPLAVWALITSALVFLPVVGFAPAIAVIILLTLHRKKVRRSRAWDHSRALCLAAVIFLVAGLFVSVLTTRGLVHNITAQPYAPISMGRAFPDQEGETTVRQAGHVQVAQLDWLTEHNWGLIGAGLLVVLLSLTVHEAAHGITAWWLGDDFARRVGRVTLNPLAHIDPVGTVILPLFLLLAGWGVFGWAKPVPVRMELVPNPRRSHILVSIAGPGSNLLLAAASMMLLLGIGCSIGLFVPEATLTNFTNLSLESTVTASGFALAALVGPVCTILKLSFFINVFLAFFNLIPIPPLDGSWVLEHLFPRTLGPIYRRVRPYSLIVFVILIYSGVLFYLLLPGLFVIGLGFVLLSLCTGF